METTTEKILKQAQRLVERGQLADAIVLLRNSIGTGSDYSAEREALAGYLVQAGRLGEAASALGQDVSGYAQRLVGGDRIDDAIKLLRHYTSAHPEDLAAREALAEYLRHSGEMKESYAELEHCTVAYAALGQMWHAMALYRQRWSHEARPSQKEVGAFSNLLLDMVRAYRQYVDDVVARSETHEDAHRKNLLPLLSSLNITELQDVVDAFDIVRMKAGRAVIRQGDTGRSMYIITRGQCRVSCNTPDFERLELARLEPGDFFGEWSVMSGDYRRHAWVEAETDLELLELDDTAMAKLIRKHPRIEEVVREEFHRRRIETLAARVFPQLTPIERALLSQARHQEKTYPAGTIIYQQGEPGGSMSLIEQGSVEVFARGRDGAEVRLAVLGPGQYFGETGALTDTPRTASVRAKTDVILYHITRKTLFDILGNHPDTMARLERIMKMRSQDTTERIPG